MPVPLPSPESVNLLPPDAEEAHVLADGVASAVAGREGLLPVQRTLIEALIPAMTGYAVRLEQRPALTVQEFAAALAPRNLQFRSRIVQMMLLCALVRRPLPEDVVEAVVEFEDELGVQESMVHVAQEFATGSLGLAAFDFERNGYTGTWNAAEAAVVMHESRPLDSAWDVSVTDPDLAARWDALGSLPRDTIGRKLWEMYEARGFAFPGRPGSAPPLLAQHDWVHVLGDYGTTVESEVEVFGLIARANDDLHAFSLLAMVISLFETGYLASGAGLFQSSVGHLSGNPGMAARLADALRRGALCHDKETGTPDVDFLRMDWFAVADLPVESLRARFCLPPKSEAAVAAGSVGPWEQGGISPFQMNAGREAAERRGILYDAHGASVDQCPEERSRRGDARLPDGPA
jgi:hypothetical protein